MEALVLPNDPFGVLQTSLLGASFFQMTPGNVLSQGWGTALVPEASVQDQPENSADLYAGLWTPSDSALSEEDTEFTAPLTGTESALTAAATAVAASDAQTTTDLATDPFADPLLHDWMATLESPFPTEPVRAPLDIPAAPQGSPGGGDSGSGGGAASNPGESAPAEGGSSSPPGQENQPDGDPAPAAAASSLPSLASGSSAGSAAGVLSTGPGDLATFIPSVPASSFSPAGLTILPVDGVNFAKRSSTTTLTLSPNASAFSGPITITANVIGSGGTPTGTVSFFDGETPLGDGLLDLTGTATFTTSTLRPGRHDITAVYGGDEQYLGSWVDPLLLADSTTAVSATPNPSTFGSSVTFTATVSGPAGTPTGSVTFYDGSAALGTQSLDYTGAASVSTSSLAIGAHTITAAYAGDDNYNSSTSSALTQTVNKPDTTTTLTSSQSPTLSNHVIELTAHVSGSAGGMMGSGAPSGSVTFYDGTTALGSQTLDNTGSAAFYPSFEDAGDHTLTAVYAGDANFNGSTSAALDEVVNDALAFTSGSFATFMVGTSNTFQITAGGTPTPTLSESGNLPTGISFTAAGASATLAGTPAPGTGGVYYVNVTAANGINPSVTQTIKLKVVAGPLFTSAAAATFIPHAANSFQITATGTPTPTFDETGDLPEGVTFVDNGNGTATLAGRPKASAVGSYSITVNATNSTGTTAQDFTFSVTPFVTVPDDQINSEGESVSLQVSTNGGNGSTVTYSASGLPNGLSINTATGLISGTIAAGAAGTGTFNCTVTAQDSSHNDTETFAWTVAAAALSIANPGAQSSTEGDEVSLAVNVTDTTGGTPTVSVTGLPAGLSFDTTAHAITGILDAGAASNSPYSVTISAVDGTYSANRAVNWTVSAPGSGSSTNNSQLWIDADSDEYTVGDSATFSLMTASNPAPTFTTVEWDFDYDGQNFIADASASGLVATPTLATAGTLTVAARLTDSANQTQIVTVDVTVDYPAPVLTVPGDMTINAGDTVNFQVGATDASGIASVVWEISFDGGDFVVDPTLTSLSISDTFSHFGEYDVLVQVTDNHGETSEDGFHVSVEEDTPTASVTYSGPFDQGGTATFTVAAVDPDNSDTVSIYAKWDGSGDFVVVEARDWVDSGGSVSFTHVYDQYSYAATATPTGFPAVIRVQDEGGQSSDYTVPVFVRQVVPTVTLRGDANFLGGTSPSGPGVPPGGPTAPPVTPLDWVVDVGDPVFFTNVSAASRAGLVYHWEIDDARVPTGTPAVLLSGEGKSPTITLPDYTVGRIYQVRGWVTDRFGTDSATQVINVVVMLHDPSPGTDFLSFHGEAGTPAGNTLAAFGAYGTLLPSGAALPGTYNDPADYNRYADAAIKIDPLTADQTLSVQLTLDRDSPIDLPGLTVAFHVQVWDVEQHTFWWNNHDLIFNQTYNVPVSAGVASFTLPGEAGSAGYPLDRELIVTAYAFQQGSLNPGGFGPSGFVTAPLTPIYSITADTPKTKTFGQQVSALWQAFKQLAQRFAAKAQDVIDSVWNNKSAFLNTLVNGLTGAVSTFFSHLANPQNLLDKFYAWLGTSMDLSAFNGFSDLTRDMPAFLLQFSGLNWSNVLNVVQQQLGAANGVAAGFVAQLLQGYNTNNPEDMLRFLNDLPTRLSTIAAGYGSQFQNLTQTLSNALASFDLPTMLSQLTTTVTQQMTATLATLPARVGGKFAPGLGVLQSIYQGVQWLLDNQDQLQEAFNGFLNSIDKLVIYDTPDFEDKLVTVFDQGFQVMLSFATSQLGLGSLKQSIHSALAYVPTQVNQALTALVSKIASALGGGTSGGLYTGKLAPERSFTYNGVNYVLWAAQDSKGLAVKVAGPGGPGGALKLIGELTATSFDLKVTPDAGKHVSALMAAAMALVKAAKAPAQKGTNTLGGLTTQQAAVTAAEDVVVADILANGCKALNAGCFRAHVLMETQHGWKRVDELRRGEVVCARSEFDPDGELAWKVVEDIFERTGCILNVRAGGRQIGTTPEHPFWVRERGWTAAGALQLGDEVRTKDGWVRIEGLEDTGVYEKVYNVRVADYHTYFVGDEGWGFGVWAHNTYTEFNNQLVAELTAAGASPPKGKLAKEAFNRSLEDGKIVTRTVEKLYKWLNKHNVVGAAADRVILAGFTNVPLAGGMAAVGETTSSTIVHQSKPMSCTAACGLQLLLDAGVTGVTETQVSTLGGTDPVIGTTDFEKMATALNTLAPNGRVWTAGIHSLTQGNILSLSFHPWIAELFFFNATRNVYHSVIVDRVVNGVAYVRDPGGISATSQNGNTAMIRIDQLVHMWTGKSIHQ